MVTSLPPGCGIDPTCLELELSDDEEELCKAKAKEWLWKPKI